MIVFGGSTGGAEVWALSLTGSPVWTQLIPSGMPPAARFGHTAIHDADRDRMIVFGGRQTSGAISGLHAVASVIPDLGDGQLGAHAQSVESLGKALALVPSSRETRMRYAEQLALAVNHGAAREALAAAGERSQESADRLVQDAMDRIARDDLVGARKQLEAAAALAPSHEMALVALVRLGITTQNLPYARSWLEGARSRGIDRNVVLAHEAVILASEGNRSAAQRVAGRIPEAARQDPRVAATLRLMREARGR